MLRNRARTCGYHTLGNKWKLASPCNDDQEMYLYEGDTVDVIDRLCTVTASVMNTSCHSLQTVYSVFLSVLAEVILKIREPVSERRNSPKDVTIAL